MYNGEHCIGHICGFGEEEEGGERAGHQPNQPMMSLEIFPSCPASLLPSLSPPRESSSRAACAEPFLPPAPAPCLLLLPPSPASCPLPPAASWPYKGVRRQGTPPGRLPGARLRSVQTPVPSSVMYRIEVYSAVVYSTLVQSIVASLSVVYSTVVYSIVVYSTVV